MENKNKTTSKNKTSGENFHLRAASDATKKTIKTMQKDNNFTWSNNILTSHNLVLLTKLFKRTYNHHD